MESLDVLISTYGDRINNIVNIIPEQKKGVRYLIGHQSFTETNGLPRLFKDREDIIYFKLDNKGVTKNRNFLIRKSTSDVYYFCDDDVVLEKNFDRLILDCHNKTNSAVVTFKATDFEGKNRKNYKNVRHSRNYLNILAVGTIEISVKNSENKIYFDESMGAGSKIPSGDEAVFLSQYLSKGLNIEFFPTNIVAHDIVSSGGIVNDQTIYARGVTIRKVFGFFGLFLILPFFFARKGLFSNQNAKKCNFIKYIKGYFLL